MGLSRKNAIILYSVVLCISIGLVTVFQSIANLILASIWITCVLFLTVYYLCKKPEPKPIAIKQQPQSVSNASEPEPLSRSLMPAAAGTGTTTSHPTDEDKASINIPTTTLATASSSKQRLDFLDNLKSFLTFIVVTHHVTCMFCGGGWYFSYGKYYNSFILFSSSLLSIDQSYFMSLFFFISGYFTPSSYAKRGTHCFLYSKFKRLGLPLLVYFCILSPILNNLINHIFIGRPNSGWYQPDFGPCWFLAWLLIFNVCYCIMDESVCWYDKKLPTNAKIFLYGFGFGVLQFIVIVLLPIGSFVGMPIAMGSLPFDILFFISGTLAKRNQWIQRIVSNSFHVYTALICVFLSIAFAFWSYFSNFGVAGLEPKKGDSESCDDDDTNGTGLEYTPFSIVIIVLFVIFSGICCFEISLGAIQFAAAKMNVRNKFTKFFSASAYTVYIIHPLIISPVGWSYTMILKYFDDGTDFVFCDGDNNSKTHFAEEWMVWIGWLYTMVVSMIILWPLAYGIKQIPGVRDVV